MLYGKTESRMPSRFIDEIPDHLLDKQVDRAKTVNVIKDSAPKTNYGIGRKTTLDSVISAYGITTASAVTAEAPVSFDFKKGDRVFHKKFGEGMICDINPTGADAEIEISFDRVGTRRLLASFAKLEKI